MKLEENQKILFSMDEKQRFVILAQLFQSCENLSPDFHRNTTYIGSSFVLKVTQFILNIFSLQKLERKVTFSLKLKAKVFPL